MQIGFIGLGIMGKPMLKNLLKAGLKPMCYARRQEVRTEASQFGAMVAPDLKTLAESCDLIITMLPDSPQVRELALGDIAEYAHPGTLLVDMSSISPLVAKEIHAGLKAKGIKMLDAPVSGGEPKAIEGTLTVMVGGDKADFELAEPILLHMASSVTYIGPIGSGNVAKLANQIIVASNIAALAEAMTLVSKAGVDADKVFQALRGGLAGSTVMEAKTPMMLARNIKPGFKVNLHIKDMQNVLESGHGLGVPLPMSAMLMEMFQAIKVAGYGDADHSALSRYFEKLAEVEIKA